MNKVQLNENKGQVDHVNKKFSCDICKKSYKHLPRLIKHCKIHAEENKHFICESCGKQFARKTYLAAHRREHSREPVFTCDICVKHFTEKLQLDTHMLLHVAERSYHCDVCDEQFSSRTNRDSHLLTHTEASQLDTSTPPAQSLHCQHCDISFQCKQVYQKHMKFHAAKTVHQCDSSEREGTEDKLKDHLKIHTEETPFTCIVCEEGFATGTSLVYHMKKHTVSKPYTCWWCAKTFSRRSALNKHLPVHIVQNPNHCKDCGKFFVSQNEMYKCKHCSKTCVSQSEFNLHMVNHMENTKTNFSCLQCEKSFYSRRELLDHNWTHLKKNMFICVLCQASLADCSSLQNHMLLNHTSEEPYQCNYCSIPFSDLNGLTTHMKMHTSEMPFKCSHCQKSFPDASTMKSHLSDCRGNFIQNASEAENENQNCQQGVHVHNEDYKSVYQNCQQGVHVDNEDYKSVSGNVDKQQRDVDLEVAERLESFPFGYVMKTETYIDIDPDTMEVKECIYIPQSEVNAHDARSDYDITGKAILAFAQQNLEPETGIMNSDCKSDSDFLYFIKAKPETEVIGCNDYESRSEHVHKVMPLATGVCDQNDFNVMENVKPTDVKLIQPKSEPEESEQQVNAHFDEVNFNNLSHNQPKSEPVAELQGEEMSKWMVIKSQLIPQ